MDKHYIATSRHAAPVEIPTNVPTGLPVPMPTMVPVVSTTKFPVPAPVASMPVPASGIKGFKLVYAPTNTVVMDLVDGSIVDLKSTRLTADFNVQAVDDGAVVRSVRFVENQRGEGAQPFAYCSHNAGDYNTCPEFAADVGDITVSVIPYTGPFQSGVALPLVSVTFRIVGGLPI